MGAPSYGLGELAPSGPEVGGRGSPVLGKTYCSLLEEHFFLHAVFCDYDVPQGLRASEVYLRASLLAHGLGGPEVAVRP